MAGQDFSESVVNINRNMQYEDKIWDIIEKGDELVAIFDWSLEAKIYPSPYECAECGTEKPCGGIV